MPGLIVLRLLAVYFGTAIVLCLLAHRFVRRISPLAAVFLVLAPLLMTGKAMLTGGVYAPLDITYVSEPFRSLAVSQGISGVKTPILSDVVASMIPWHKAVREAAKNGRFPLWNRFCLVGEPLLAVLAHGALHPENWIGFLLPLAQAWTFLSTLRLFISLLGAYLFFFDLTGRELPSLFGSAAWALCDFLLFFNGYPLSPAIGPLPLLLLGLRLLAREPGWRGVAVSMAALLLSVTAGHPESLLHVVAAGGVYFLFELWWTKKAQRARAIRLSLLAGALTLGLSAVTLLPFAQVLPATFDHSYRSNVFAHERKSLPWHDSVHFAEAEVVPYAFGVSGVSQVKKGFYEPRGYGGSVLWPLAGVGLLSRRREKWAFLVFAILGLSLGISLVGVTDAVSSLPLFRIALNERMTFLLSFALAALGVLGFERLQEGEAHPGLAIAALVAAVVLTLVFLKLEPRALGLGMPQAELTRRFGRQLVPLLLVAGVAVAGRRRPQAAALAMILVLLGQRRAEAGSFYPTFRASAFFPPLPVLDPIPRGEPYRFTAVGDLFVPNVSALYELEDVRGYSSMTLLPMVETFSLWCVPQPIWFNRVDDPTRPFLSFLNVRYVLVPPLFPVPAGWKVLARGPGAVLLENPRVLPRAFVPRLLDVVASPAQQIETLGQITDFGNEGVIEVSEGQSEKKMKMANGEATVSIVSYLPQAMTLSVEAREPTIVATSVPRWPGWRLSLDGRPWEDLRYNRAFVAFRVPTGRHTAVLRYWPEGFQEGLWISSVTFLVVLLLAAWRWQRRAGEDSGLPESLRR